MKTGISLMRSLLAGALLLAFLSLLVRQAAADLYASDSSTGKVYRYTPDGVRHVFASIPQAYCLSFDSANNLYVAAYGRNTIYKIRPNGQKSVFASGDLVANPVALAFDSTGSLYVSHGTIDTGIDKLNPDGSITHYLGNFDFGGLALDSAGYLYATELLNSNILKIAPGGSYREIADSFAYPGRLTFDSADNLYAVDYYNGFVYKIRPDGFETQFAAVPYPVALTFDNSGYLFVATSYNGAGAIVEIASDGTIVTFATGLKTPVDLAVPNFR